MHDSFVAVLSSGSCGNSTLVATGESDVLVDAGISCREIERKVSAFGRDPSEVKAVLLTHEHTDHNRGARRFCRVHDVPLYGTEGTLALTPHDGADLVRIRSGVAFSVDDIAFRPFAVKHLAAEPVGFAARIRDKKVSIASDLGSISEGVVEEMRDSDMIMLEANYDHGMLMGGRYPEFLKKTIAGDHGHLSNVDSGKLCSEAVSERTRRVVLLHLSRDNNTSDLARDTVSRSISKRYPDTEVVPTEHGSQNGPFTL